jgi:DNA repair exonuclease SbcCD nuclease subunit
MDIANRKALSLLHMSDLHIGTEAYDEAPFRGLESALAKAHEKQVDAILIAGDLFDSHRVPEETIDRVLNDLAAGGRPVIVLPGNHDAVLTQGLWLGETPSGVTIMKESEGEMVLLEDLGLAVWGRPVYDHRPEFRPLEGMPPRPWSEWYVAMAHGLFMEVPEEPPRSSPISPEEIGAATCDYLALGHVHAFRDVSQNGVPAFYSGAPSASWTKTVALVELDPATGVSVSQLQLP